MCTILLVTAAHADITIDDTIVSHEPISTEDFNYAKDNLNNANLNDLQNKANSKVSEDAINNALIGDSNSINQLQTDRLNDEERDTITSAQNNSSDDDDCAIWLCLPSRFPEGCANAHKRFLKRVKKHLSPLPSFSSCLKQVNNMTFGNSSTMSYTNNVAAYIPKHKVIECVEYKMNYSSQAPKKECSKYQYFDVDEAYIKNVPCLHGDHGTTTPLGCTNTVNYIDIQLDNAQYGSTYYY